jgi:hypothetical protein
MRIVGLKIYSFQPQKMDLLKTTKYLRTRQFKDTVPTLIKISLSFGFGITTVSNFKLSKPKSCNCHALIVVNSFVIL